MTIISAIETNNGNYFAKYSDNNGVKKAAFFTKDWVLISEEPVRKFDWAANNWRPRRWANQFEGLELKTN